MVCIIIRFGTIFLGLWFALSKNQITLQKQNSEKNSADIRHTQLPG